MTDASYAIALSFMILVPACLVYCFLQVVIKKPKRTAKRNIDNNQILTEKTLEIEPEKVSFTLSIFKVFALPITLIFVAVVFAYSQRYEIITWQPNRDGIKYLLKHDHWTNETCSIDFQLKTTYYPECE